MECYYHPERESSENCAICGKSICKECGLEIAGKTYCKECLEKIVGLGIENNTAPQNQNAIHRNHVEPEPARLDKRPITETIYESQAEEAYAQNEIRPIHEDSPYNIRNAEPSYAPEREITPHIKREEPQLAQNKYDVYNDQIPQQSNSQEYIYPDHSYESSSANLEDKYERYLDDLYFDENELPLEEQLAKDEEEYGSLTRRPYHPRTEEALQREQASQKRKFETPEEMEARIRAEILAEKDGGKIRDSNIHNLNYKDEKEPMNVVDVILTIILVIVILIVIYYLLYVFILNNTYPTFMDAIFGLTNPQNVINNLLTPQQ